MEKITIMCYIYYMCPKAKCVLVRKERTKLLMFLKKVTCGAKELSFLVNNKTFSYENSHANTDNILLKILNDTLF